MQSRLTIFIAALATPLGSLLLLLPALGFYPWFQRLADPDLFARMAMGRLIVQTAQIPYTDPFAFTPKLPYWIDHEWLSGLLFYGVAANFGEWGLHLTKLGFFTATLFVVLVAQYRSVTPNRTSPGLTLLFFWPTLYLWHTTIRAQVFTYLLLALVLCCLVTERKGERSLLTIVLPLSFPVFANAHGGFVLPLGFLALGGVALLFQQGNRRVFLAAVIGGISTLINPYGIAYWDYLLNALSMARPSIIEWRALPSTSFLMVYLFAAVGVLAWGELRRRENIRYEVLLFGALALIAALRSGRFLAVGFFVVAVYGVPVWQALLRNISATRAFRIQTAALVSYVAIILPWLHLSYAPDVGAGNAKSYLQYDPYPVQLLEKLFWCAEPGNLLVHFNTGSYALWRLYPKMKISLDGRYEEVYPDSTVDLVANSLSFGSSEQPAALNKINPDYVLLDKGWGSFSHWQHSLPNYIPILEDGKFLLASKKRFEDCRVSSPRDVLVPSF